MIPNTATNPMEASEKTVKEMGCERTVRGVIAIRDSVCVALNNLQASRLLQHPRLIIRRNTALCIQDDTKLLVQLPTDALEVATLSRVQQWRWTNLCRVNLSRITARARVLSIDA